MRILEMKITVPEVKGGRCVSTEMKDGDILAKFEIEEDDETPSVSKSKYYRSEFIKF